MTASAARVYPPFRAKYVGSVAPRGDTVVDYQLNENVKSAGLAVRYVLPGRLEDLAVSLDSLLD